MKNPFSPSSEKPLHTSVMMKEVLQGFEGAGLSVFYEGTLGAGGHAKALLEAHPEIESYLGCDKDPEALEIARKVLLPWKEKVELIQGDFADLDLHLKERGIKTVNGFFFDLGVSSMQFDKKEKGFAFSKEGPLDMRMDPSEDLTAREIVNEWPESKLGEIFREFGEEPRWRKAAQTIVRAREKEAIETTKQLAELIAQELGKGFKKKLHPATLIFQALRICVNRELESIQKALPKALEVLQFGGRIGVMSFHRLEDRIVKGIFKQEATVPARNKFKEYVQKPMLRLLNKKPYVPSMEEVRRNPRARSAKLRFAEKVMR